MDAKRALAFLKEHGVVLMSAKGPAPNLAEAIAGAPFRGSWWGHPKSHAMFAAFEALRESPDVLTCRLVDGKVTFVHRRLWPALIRLAERMAPHALDAVREEHTASGRHRTTATPFPDWVPGELRAEAARLTVADAETLLGQVLAALPIGKVDGVRKARPRRPAR